MRKLAYLIIFAAIMIGVFFASMLALPAFAQDEENIYFKIDVKRMLAEPRKDANEIYSIPIEVKALGVTPDLNWVKVRIAFDLVFLGHYEYEGWVHAPLGDILRAKKENEPLPQTAAPKLPF